MVGGWIHWDWARIGSPLGGLSYLQVNGVRQAGADI